METNDERKAVMEGRLRTYLGGERTAARWHLGFSLFFLPAGAWLLYWGAAPLWLGVGWPLLLLGGIQAWAGWQQLREWRQLNGHLPELLQRDPRAFARLENERMPPHLLYHRRLRLAALTVLILGILLVLAGGVVRPLPFTLGLGTGCCLQGAAMLVLTISGHWRNELYAYEVQTFADRLPGA